MKIIKVKFKLIEKSLMIIVVVVAYQIEFNYK